MQFYRRICSTSSEQSFNSVLVIYNHQWLGGLLVERRTSVSQIRGSIPGQVAAV